mgnify:CR=1 FL=1
MPALQSINVDDVWKATHREQLLATHKTAARISRAAFGRAIRFPSARCS